MCRAIGGMDPKGNPFSHSRNRTKMTGARLDAVPAAAQQARRAPATRTILINREIYYATCAVRTHGSWEVAIP